MHRAEELRRQEVVDSPQLAAGSLVRAALIADSLLRIQTEQIGEYSHRELASTRRPVVESHIPYLAEAEVLSFPGASRAQNYFSRLGELHPRRKLFRNLSRNAVPQPVGSDNWDMSGTGSVPCRYLSPYNRWRIF